MTCDIDISLSSTSTEACIEASFACREEAGKKCV